MSGRADDADPGAGDATDDRASETSGDGAASPTTDTVLVVDGDEEIREMVRFKLQREADVVTAADGRECWEYLDDHGDAPPGVVVLDVMMPGMNGRQVLRRIRDDRRFDDVAVVMLTSLGRSDEAVEALEAGATDYMSKPFSPDELLARIRRARG